MLETRTAAGLRPKNIKHLANYSQPKAKMRDKVLLSYIIIDALFVITGAIMVGFCVIIKNSMFATPTSGDQAARDLLYQQFPLNGMCLHPPLCVNPARLWHRN